MLGCDMGGIDFVKEGIEMFGVLVTFTSVEKEAYNVT